MTKNYSETVKSSLMGKTLSNLDKVRIKNGAYEKLDALLDETERVVLGKIVDIVEIAVHNEKAKSGDTEYSRFVIFGTDRTVTTGSENLIESITDITSELSEDDEYSLFIYRQPSSNFKGKYFMTCSIA